MPLQKYLSEIKWRLFYCTLTFLLCFCTSILFIDIFFLIEIKPLINLGHKSFLATHVTDFFLATLSVSSFFSQLLTFPVVAYHVYYFFAPSFYFTQLLFLKRYIICSSFGYIISFLSIYHFFAPEALSFLVQWGNFSSSDFLDLELDIRIKEYLEWVNRNYNIVNLVLQIFSNSVLYSLFSLKVSTSFHYLKFYRKHLLFILLSFFYAMLPPDLVLQFALLSILFILSELFFYTICFRSKQSNFSW